jgi:hypothetical protein
VTIKDILRKRWNDEARFQPFHSYLTINDTGLQAGVGTLLSKMVRDESGAPVLALTGEEERLLALLSLAYRERISIDALKFIKRASIQWARGEKAFAHFELAYARLPKLECWEDAWLLFYADGLIADGDLLKYNRDQARVPAGHGRESGEWTIGNRGTQVAQRPGPSVPRSGGHGEIMSDAVPDPILPGQQYAQTSRGRGPVQLPIEGRAIGGGRPGGVG